MTRVTRRWVNGEWVDPTPQPLWPDSPEHNARRAVLADAGKVAVAVKEREMDDEPDMAAVYRVAHGERLSLTWAEKREALRYMLDHGEPVARCQRRLRMNGQRFAQLRAELGERYQ